MCVLCLLDKMHLLRGRGAAGEGEVQGMWIVKTHFPERKTPSAEKAFKAKKVGPHCSFARPTQVRPVTNVVVNAI